MNVANPCWHRVQTLLKPDCLDDLGDGDGCHRYVLDFWSCSAMNELILGSEENNFSESLAPN